MAIYIVLAGTVLASVVKYYLIRIDYDMRYYVVTDRSLRIREGALSPQTGQKDRIGSGAT